MNIREKMRPVVKVTTRMILTDWNACWQIEEALRAVIDHQKPDRVNGPAASLRLAQAALLLLLQEQPLPRMRMAGARRNTFDAAQIGHLHDITGHQLKALHTLERAVFFEACRRDSLTQTIQHLDRALLDLDLGHQRMIAHEHH
jgi:hypothetical protein